MSSWRILAVKGGTKIILRMIGKYMCIIVYAMQILNGHCLITCMVCNINDNNYILYLSEIQMCMII